MIELSVKIAHSISLRDVVTSLSSRSGGVLILLTPCYRFRSTPCYRMGIAFLAFILAFLAFPTVMGIALLE